MEEEAIIDYENIEKIREIPINLLYELNIIKDGNCFFNCLSYFFHNTQKDSFEFRKIIYECIKSNKEELIPFFPDENNETKEEKIKRFDEYIETISKNGNLGRKF